MALAQSQNDEVQSSTAVPEFGIPHTPLRPRVVVQIPGKYMLENKREYSCRTSAISAAEVAIEAEHSPGLEEHVVLYLQHLGRLEGRVMRVSARGFEVELHTTETKLFRISDQLTWLANRHLLGPPEARRHERIIPFHTLCILTTHPGHEQLVTLVDVSLSGAAFRLQGKPLRRLVTGAHVTLGSRAGTIVRTFAGGGVIGFERLIDASEFDETILL